MSSGPAFYNPNSKILFISICSLHKKTGGNRQYFSQESIGSRLSPESGETLLKKREEVRNLIWSGSVSWGGIDTAELEYNKYLAPGPDFGGSENFVEYLPAILRYTGRFYLALGDEGKRKIAKSNHHVLLLSGLYGLVTPTESIQLYSCPVEGKSVIQNIWTDQQTLTNILVDYIRNNGITQVFDFTARNDYRKLIDWDYLKRNSNVKAFHCFTKMSAYDYALIEFGTLLRETLLDYSESDLLAISSESVIGEVIFRNVPDTWDGLPKEEAIFIIENSAKEIPSLPSYPLSQIPKKLGILQEEGSNFQSAQDRETWLVAFTSEFRKNLDQYNDKKLQGRVLEALADIVKAPVTKRGDTVKDLKGPLEGKWRYRIGDYRLIYYPDEQTRKVSLIAFQPRGNAYFD